MPPFNKFGTPLVCDVTFAELQLDDGEFKNLDTHYFYREDESGEWVWGCRPSGGEIETRIKLNDLQSLLTHFIKSTSLADHAGVSINRGKNATDQAGSMCVSDVLKLIGPALIGTKITNVIVDGESHAAPIYIRWGPRRWTEDERVPAVYIPLIPGALFSGSSQPLINNVAMTDLHSETEEWHLWEALYKSGDNYMLFQSELGYDDQMFHAVSGGEIPLELLKNARSFEVQGVGPDRHAIDKWGFLILSVQDFLTRIGQV